MNKQSKIKQRLEYAKISQKTIAENLEVSNQFVNAVMNGRESSSKVINEATRLLDEVLNRDAGLKAFFESRGI